MKNCVVFYSNCGFWTVFHLPNGSCVMSPACAESVALKIHEQGYSYFVFDVDSLCNHDVDSLSDVTLDWRCE